MLLFFPIPIRIQTRRLQGWISQSYVIFGHHHTASSQTFQYFDRQRHFVYVYVFVTGAAPPEEVLAAWLGAWQWVHCHPHLIFVFRLAATKVKMFLVYIPDNFEHVKHTSNKWWNVSGTEHQRRNPSPPTEQLQQRPSTPPPPNQHTTAVNIYNCQLPHQHQPPLQPQHLNLHQTALTILLSSYSKNRIQGPGPSFAQLGWS